MSTVAQWLHSTADLPRFDCELLLHDLLGLSRAQLLTHPEHLIDEAQLAALNARVVQLRDGCPTAYVLGQQEFWGLPFAVNPHVLIPRPETELLVEQALEYAPQGGRVLDLGTGSGAVAVALAHTRPDLHITAVDNSPAALEVASTNARDNAVNVTFEVSDWFSAISGQWDVIVSNPPYIAAGDPHLPALRHEPQQALQAGADGLDALAQIITAAPDYLRVDGSLLLEHGYNQADAVAQLLAEAGFVQLTRARDLAGIERISGGRKRQTHTG